MLETSIFEAVSDLILEVKFYIKRSTLLNTKRKEEDNESNLKIKEERDFFELIDQFEEKLVEYLFNSLEHKKIKHLYLNHKFRVLKQ